MLIDLSNVLSEPHRSVDETVPCELKIFRNGLGEYPVTESSDIHVKINYMENGKLQIEGTCKLTVETVSYTHLDVYKRQDHGHSGGGGSTTHVSSSGRSHGGRSGGF